MAAGKKTGGRTKGTPNKVTSGVKANIQSVFNKIGGQAAMAKWAKDNPTEFYKIYARLIPQEVVGEGGGPIVVKIDADLAKVI